MKAMLLSTPGPIANRPLTLTKLSLPEPSEREIRLKVSACGVCHTDLHTVEGDLSLPKLPLVPGHQVVGVVEKLGPNARKYKLGRRVGAAWLNWSCGSCRFCAQGLENLCQEARFTGLHSNGGYSEYAVIDERFAFALPETMSDAEVAPLLCAGIVGFRSLLLSGVQPGDNLGLYGFGASAHLAIQVARYWNCHTYVFTRSASHQHHALELGAAWAGTSQDKPPARMDASIVFAPAGWIVPLALEHLRPGGTLAINAIHMSPIPEMDYNRIYHERVLRSVANFTRRDAEVFLRLAADIPIKSQVTAFPLSEANHVLEKLKSSQIQGAAVLRI